jgi:WD40 repeat protein
VELIDAASRELAGTLTGHAGAVNTILFSADGARLIAAGGEPGLFGEARLWSLEAGAGAAEWLRTIRGHQDALYAAALSPDGSLLATAGYDQGIRLWETSSGLELREISGHHGAVFDLAFRAGGRVLASASADRTVKLWEARSGLRLDTFSQSFKELHAVAFSPDGRRLAAGGADNRIRLWQVSEGAEEGTNRLLQSRFAHEGAILELAFSPDGRRLASSADDRSVKLWDAASLSELHVLEPQPDWPVALAFSADGATLLAGRLDGTIGWYHAPSGLPLRLAAAPRPPAASILRGAAGAAALLAGALAAEEKTETPPPRPEVTGVEPRGLERGRSARVKLAGKHLAALTEVKVHSPGLSAALLPAAAEGTAEAWIEVSSDAALAPGAYEVSVLSAGGESNKLKLFVDDLTQVPESEPNDQRGAGPPHALPASFWGVIERRGDLDHFAFELQAGETVVLDLAAARLGSKLNAVLLFLDGAGRVIASSNDFDGSSDPLIAYQSAGGGRYFARVSDLEMKASGEHFYRLSAGVFPFVTGVFPLGITAGGAAEIELAGYNIPAGAAVRIEAPASGEVTVPLDAALFRSRGAFKVLATTGPEAVESEPNDEPAQATPIAAPGAVSGRIQRRGPQGGGDADLFRFRSEAGRRWVIETEAARRDSPIDTRIEVLDAEGRPIERLLLQAVRDSYVTFRGIDSNTNDVRLVNWEEMELNEYLYLQGEVVRLFLAPRGPDSGYGLYASQGKRRTYFDTSATAHSLDEPCYIVEPHPPGTKLFPNGLPVFTLHYENDDDGDRKLGRDSRLSFTAPAAGDYLVRVTDAGGEGGDRYAYRLIVREARPDFRVTLQGANPAVGAGSGKGFTLALERIDGFDGEVAVHIAEVPPGFRVSTPVVIEAGHLEARGTVFAEPGAAAPAADAPPPKVVAEAMVEGLKVVREVNSLGRIRLEAKPKLLVRLEAINPPGAAEIPIAPGETVPALLRIERHGHDDLVTFSVDNLPHGVIVDDIGLNGVLIRKGENERQIFLTAAKWVPETDRWCHAVEGQAGAQTSPPVLIKVRKPQAPAGR